MEGTDVGASQEVVRELAKEDGLSFVKNAVDKQVPSAGDSFTQARLLTTVMVPLFRWVTHPRVVDSAVLEQEVSTIFNFMLGIGGRRMTTLYNFITSGLQTWSALNITELSRMEMLELSLNVLSKVLECNTANVVNEAFNPLADRFASLLGSEDEDESYSTLQAKRYMDYIKLRLGVGAEIQSNQERRPEPVIREQFVLRRDLPGELSAEGPRHDNDHADITKIKIMPTAEEIMSPRAEYLPTTDSREWHHPGMKGRVDREFRLLREDTVGQLRDTVRGMLEVVQNPGQRGSQQSRNSARTYVYELPVPREVSFQNPSGLEILVEFAQPELIRGMNLKQRQEWWQHCKRLQEGALVCVFDVTGAVLFFEVSESTLRTGEDEPKKRQHHMKQHEDRDAEAADEKKLSLADDDKCGFVSLRLVDSNRHTLTQTLRWYRNIGLSLRRRLVEFPGVLLASFKHTLEALQEISRQPKLPFTDLIAPSDKASQEAHVNLPLYARQPGFTYDLSCLTTDRQALEISARDLRRESALDLVSSRTLLDPTQSSAFLDALSKELSLVQGPPGTGKSFTGEKIIKALIANTSKAKLGPILCVCYTNHALDQLLEHLLDEGTKEIIRIGSRSKSERIQDLNLRTVAQAEERTKTEKRSLYEQDMELKSHVHDAKHALSVLATSNSEKSVKSFISVHHPGHHREIFGHMEVNEEGWQQVVHSPDRLIPNWLRGGSRTEGPVRPVEVLRHGKLSDMTHAERMQLHRDWLRAIRDPLIKEIVDTERDFTATKNQRDRVRRDVDLRCLQQAHIVGVTTTGLARNLDLLRKLRCKVMVCEEAGEVLEAHLLTALLPSVEHAILVGDHLQLRPQIQNYDLQSTNPRGERYSLDLSMFERLVKPPHDDDVRLPFSVLHTQRRMHPSIAELVRSTLYPHLTDGGKVSSYPEVVGMKKRLFWLHHENLEAGASSQDPNSTSHSNSFEIEMTVALVSHLVRQGEYGPDDIAVLTPYLGQLLKLRRRMESMFEISISDRDMEDLEALGEDASTPSPVQVARGPSPVTKTTLLKSLRVATVDNFQGEEAKVIVISLVRSNPQNKCGFLNTPNRINVLLSRAKHGMYVIGNAHTYSPVPMWSSVINTLQANGNFGNALELQCPRHPDTPIVVKKPDDFLVYAPESGCNEACDRRLQCGHKCSGRCHSEMLHKAFKCLEKCQRLKPGCTHACPLVCGERCHVKCQTHLTDINLKLPCGHTVNKARCWETQEPKVIRCSEMVTRNVPGCGHVVQVPCFMDVTASDYRCDIACGHERECGHKCVSECWQCNTRADGELVKENHGFCEQVCGRQYTTCRHNCQDFCHGSRGCSPCPAPCEVRCSHSKCSKKCHEPCAPCAEAKCASGCAHSQCTMPCAAPCDCVPCSKRCDTALSCGHQCKFFRSSGVTLPAPPLKKRPGPLLTSNISFIGPSTCSEPCPEAKYCQVCGTEPVKSAIVDFIEMSEYRDINLDEDPCIFPDCGHFFTATSMDGQMDMSAHYDIDPWTGHPVAIKASSQPFSMDEIKVCATCRGQLRNVARYGRIVRRAMLDEATKKFITWSVGRHLALADELLMEQNRLEATVTDAKKMSGPSQPAGKAVLLPSRSRLGQLVALSKAAGRNRYAVMMRLWHGISKFAGEVQREEQPFQRVADLVRFANQQHMTRGEFVFDESVLQVKGTVTATALLLRCELVVFSDFLELREDGNTTEQYGEVKLDFDVHLAECSRLVDLACDSKLLRQEVEGHIYFAQFCGFARTLSPDPDTVMTPEQQSIVPGNIWSSPPQSSKHDILKAKGLAHTAEASRIIAAHPSLANLVPQVEAAEQMLHEGSFYQAVSAEELRAVYGAMANSFRGTGHWYTCQNGHPFTVGECGMPMEQVRCPECEAPIGGQHHRPAEGVRRAEEMDDLATGVQGMGL
jgi:hypothetical protein